MGEPSPSLRRGPVERLLAWLVTGPLGHFWSVVVDIAVFATRALGGRLRQRLQRMELGAGRRLRARR